MIKLRKGFMKMAAKDRTFEESVMNDILDRMCRMCKEHGEDRCDYDDPETWVKIDCLENILLTDERITEN